MSTAGSRRNVSSSSRPRHHARRRSSAESAKPCNSPSTARHLSIAAQETCADDVEKTTVDCNRCVDDARQRLTSSRAAQTVTEHAEDALAFALPDAEADQPEYDDNEREQRERDERLADEQDRPRQPTTDDDIG